ncbi:IclR family transcriptional regulator [Oscillibacter sp.]|uniref:IclR family transcriptional regulator n=1 Tax=Oscillibacter sp. TaxID=1945593 RepID=UPI0028AF5F69|nr:IclR family transcriptional regulator [Oscillibacter sp.]
MNSEREIGMNWAQDPKVKSLAKALRILECFSVDTPELGVTELAEMNHITKSNAHNILTTFQQGGYVVKQPNGKYALGLQLLEFSYIINQHLGYPRAVYDLLTDLANKTGEIVYFGLPHGTDVLYLYVAHPIARMQELPYRDMLGEHAPLYCTGIGKAILSAMPEEEWEKHITPVRTPFTDATVIDHDQIIEELWRTRRRGYSIDNCGREYNVRCVGAPVFSGTGRLVAGISTSGPVSAMTDEKLLHCSKLVIDTARRMRERIYH